MELIAEAREVQPCSVIRQPDSLQITHIVYHELKEETIKNNNKLKKYIKNEKHQWSMSNLCFSRKCDTACNYCDWHVQHSMLATFSTTILEFISENHHHLSIKYNNLWHQLVLSVLTR